MEIRILDNSGILSVRLIGLNSWDNIVVGEIYRGVVLEGSSGVYSSGSIVSVLIVLGSGSKGNSCTIVHLNVSGIVVEFEEGEIVPYGTSYVDLYDIDVLESLNLNSVVYFSELAVAI